MKKLLSITCLTLCISSISQSSFAQKIIKNEVDKYTKNHVITTSKEVLYRNAITGGWMKCSMSQKNMTSSGNTYNILKLHFLRSSVFSISESGYLYLVLDNDESIKIKCLSGGVSRSSGKYESLTASYLLTEEQFDKLTEHDVLSMRIDLLDTYIARDLAKKRRPVITRCAKLISKTSAK